MASLISDAQKASLQAVMGHIHDTFQREIKAYREGKQVVISSSPGYSHIYKSASQSVAVQPVERSILARVFYYARSQDKETVPLSGDDYLKLAQAAAVVRIKIKQADWDFLKECERFIIDGTPFQVTSTGMPHGLFGSGFYTLYLQRTT
jgi:hypothetical protein